MSGYLGPAPRQQFLDANGKPLAYGKLYTYLAGTNIPHSIGADMAFSSSQPNPLILDAYGRCYLFLDERAAYKFVLADANDVIQWTQEPVKVAWTDTPSSAIETGTMVLWAGVYAPSAYYGWLLCDGSFVGQAVYPALYAAIGQTYLDGQAYQDGLFPLPNFKTVTTGAGGRFPLGRSNGGTGAVLGESGGTIDHLHTVPSHTHPGPSHTHDVTLTGTNDNVNPTGTVASAQTVTSAADGTEVTSGTALSSSTTNPPFLTLNWIIRL